MELMGIVVIEVAKDFSRTPGGRYIGDGPASGELFRNRVLAPRLTEGVRTGKKVVVLLDGVRGYLSSFLEEAFGGLVRECGFTQSELSRVLEIRANDPFYEPYKRLALRYISEAREKAIAG
jgi:hypothetical protein